MQINVKNKVKKCMSIFYPPLLQVEWKIWKNFNSKVHGTISFKHQANKQKPQMMIMSYPLSV